MSDLRKRLDNLKSKQEQSQRLLDRMDGQKAQLEQQLKSEFGISTLEQGKAKLESMRKDLARREMRIDRMLSELEAVCNAE